MATLSVEQSNGGIPAQMQLLILHCLSAALNRTQNNSTEITTADSISSRQLITVSLDKSIFDDDIKEKFLDVENKLTNKILEFKSAVIEEVRKSSCKSEELLPELIRNISSTSNKNQELLALSIQENSQLFKTNEELQINLETLTQNSQRLQKTQTEENSRLSERNKDLQAILGNVTIANRDLEGKVQELQDKLLKQIDSNHGSQLNLKEKDVLLQELQGKFTQATQRIQELNESLLTVTEKYSTIKQGLGISDSPVNYCKIQSSSVLWKLAHKDSQSQTPSGATVWKPSHTELGAGKMQLQYSSTQDKYFRSVDKHQISGWDKGVYKQSEMFRMVENDFKVAYLARKVGTTEGIISWKFDLSDTGRSVDNVRLVFTTALFFGGIVDASICSLTTCEPIPGGNGVFETRNFQGVSQLEIIAKTRLGRDSAAWQHAQLFRQLLSDITGYGFDVTITFMKCDITVL